MKIHSRLWPSLFIGITSAAFLGVVHVSLGQPQQPVAPDEGAAKMLAEGKQIFRFDTFGSEDFWGGSLKLHRAIEGERFGGVGPGVSPKKALSLGLKVDAAAVPKEMADAIKAEG